MEPEQAAGQVLWIGFHGRDPDARLLALARDGALGGIVLFRRNLGAPEHVAALVDAHVRACPDEAPPLVAVDQEGGRVARLGPPVLRLPAARVMGRLNSALVERAAATLGRQLRALGFSADFAPVLDVDTRPDSPVIGDRAFGETPDAVIEAAGAFARGLRHAGILYCGKHFPGHGDAALDSHLALPVVLHDLARLEAVEIAPFAALCGDLPMVMTAHVLYEALDPERPATLSRPILQGLLRERLGFRGLVVSDDLEMRAVADRWSVAQAAVLAVEAGCDALLVCSDVGVALQARDALASRAASDPWFASRLRDAARRGLELRARHRPKPVTDPIALAAALDVPERAELEAELVRAHHGA
ncbi:MAG: beta-N-acetylhexosaminidase [Myxococcota bacterium]|nr:beta-N-acetylhexosaminidase [Myxococcota bacterium]MDW8362801.1 beta-N-acetylhexosaminidase [Myxococcales bacterium]